MNKQELISKIKSLQDISSEEKAYLIELVNTKKKYGLVWEEKPEDVEEQLRSMLPVFKEVKERAIISEDKDAPNHILIEGDNLHALTALSYTHEGKIDVIYIDPPYNTGNKDFIYNDAYVDKEDTYRHSKWLSFMDKRLRLAKKLLSEKGVIFISIDDNELSQLKLLCDEVFGENNLVAIVPAIMNLKGNHDKYGFSDTHEYFLVYTKIKENRIFGQFEVDEVELNEEWNEDEYGYWKKADTLRRTGQDAAREKRPKGWFPIFITTNNEIYVTENDEPLNTDDFKLLPINDNGDELSWTWQKSKIINENYNLLVTRARNGGPNIYKKQRPQLGDLPTKKPKSFFYKPEYSTSTSTTHLKNILGVKKFDAPKPLKFLIDLIVISNSKNSTILDFFAGSGTTLHATMALNAEDGGNRQCILVTNNENKIAEEVTYERNKRVIQGYTNVKGEQVEGLVNNNLRYFQADFVPSERTEINRRLLTARSTELLCIKEDCFLDVTKDYNIKERQAKLFTNGLGKYMIVIYHSRNQEEVISQLTELIKNLETTEKIKLYAFSPEKESIEEDFFAVADKIAAVPLPDSIYNAYRATFRTLKLNNKRAAVNSLNQDI